MTVRILDEPIDDLRTYAEEVLATSNKTAPTQALAGRSAATTDVLLVPYYESDRHDPNGVNTLFAVRNETIRDRRSASSTSERSAPSSSRARRSRCPRTPCAPSTCTTSRGCPPTPTASPAAW